MGKRDGATAYADGRPRIHMWGENGRGFETYSIGATGTHFEAEQSAWSIGRAIDEALSRVDASKGVVVIIEPRLG